MAERVVCFKWFARDIMARSMKAQSNFKLNRIPYT